MRKQINELTRKVKPVMKFEPRTGLEDPRSIAPLFLQPQR